MTAISAWREAELGVASKLNQSDPAFVVLLARSAGFGLPFLKFLDANVGWFDIVLVDEDEVNFRFGFLY